MRRLTKRFALQITAELWIWLAENPSSCKEEWKGWAEYGRMSNYCPLCEYASRHRSRYDEMPCTMCPLYSKWDGYAECMDRDSPYQLWLMTQVPATKSEYAHRIAELCLAELKMK